MQKKALLRKQFQRAGIDGLLITDTVNVRYLTGFTGSSGFVLIAKKHALFVTDFRYQEQARNEVRGFTLKIENKERSSEIKDICQACSVRKLGFETDDLTYGFYRKLRNRKFSLVPVSGMVESLRMIKSADERQRIRASAKRAEGAFRKLLPHIKEGASERKLALKFEGLLKESGCKILPFEVIVASGPMSALPHAQPTNRRLKKGDLVVIDWGGEYEGYMSDMTRTVLMKGPDLSRQRDLYATVLEAQKRALGAVKAGIEAAHIDAAARDYINKKGFDDFFGHGTGHGVGLAVHEKPVVSWRSREKIREHMIFTVEPGIYLPGFGGVRIEDMVAVTKAGAELLTSLPKKLRIVEG